MNPLSRLRELFENMESRTRLRLGYGVIALLAVALGLSLFASKTAELERRRQAREEVLKELMPLKAAYRTARVSADMLAGRMASVRAEDSPARVIEEIGIRGKGVKITPAKGETRGNLVEDAADVRIDGLTLNEAVNLVYRLEKGSRPLILKRSNLRVRFDDPSRCDLSLTVALLKPSPGAAR